MQDFDIGKTPDKSCTICFEYAEIALGNNIQQLVDPANAGEAAVLRSFHRVGVTRLKKF